MATVKKTPNNPFQYPDPPPASSSSAPVPVPQPPKVQQGTAPAPPPTQTAPAGQGWGVSGQPPIQPPAPGPTPSPYAATGVKGAPIPGQTVPVTSPTAPKSSVTPIGPAAHMLNLPPDTTGGPPAPTSAPNLPGGGGGSPFAGSDQDKLNYIASHPNDFDTSIPPEQWKAWLPDLDKGCPGNKPFKTSRPGPGGNFTGPERCVSKPDDCPEGFRVIGNDQSGTARCLPQGDSAFGPGGGGGGPSGPGGPAGPGGGGGGGFNPAAGFGGVDETLQKLITGDLQNPVSRYTPEAMAMLLSGTKATAEDQSQQTRDAIAEDAAARGVLGGGATGTALANARIAANRTVAGEQQNIARAKIDADFQDKQAAIKNGFDYLNSARDWAYKQQMTALQRQQFEANLTLAYARLQQEWDQMQAGYGYQALLGGLG